MPNSVDQARIQGVAIPSEVAGFLNESEWHPNAGGELHSAFERDGYLLLRGALNQESVLAAREEVFGRLIEVDEIRPPAVDGIATGTSRREELQPDLGCFWQSVSEGPRLRQVSHGEAATEILTSVFGLSMRPHDYIFLRPGVVGRATRLHYDLPFFARGSDRIVTVWTALGDIPITDGPLVVVENSHAFEDLLESVRQIDYESSESPTVQLLDDAIEFARDRGSRLLTTDFRTGDLIIFSMTTMHGTLDNHSSIGRTRLSCDVRWQPADDPFDPRYQGPNPAGTTGAGYAELNGAKPLTQDWHTR